MRRDSVTLDDKYCLERGEIFLSGIQALVRLSLEQKARDEAVGLRTAGFVSGYRGSPLAGLDRQLWAAGDLLERRRIHFQPGLNEELAATAVWGSQQLGLHPGAHYEGVFGLWYGKAPGLDRASDALRHANAAGTAPSGGVLLVAGDDHACKSSSYPTQSEFALMDMEIPVLAPSSVQEVLDYGLYGWALSRYAGLWVGLIALADLMDASAVVRVDPSLPLIRWPERAAGDVHIRPHDVPKEQERRIREQKLPAVLAFARANHFVRSVFDTPHPRLAIVASGKAYGDTRQALDDLGIDARVAAEVGIRLIKVAMPWPLDAESVRPLLEGVDDVLVVEEKRPLVEAQLEQALYALPSPRRPRIVGKRDRHAAPLLAQTFTLDPEAIAKAIALSLPAGVSTERIDDALARLVAEEHAPAAVQPAAERVPFFCSGCPHNASTRLPEGSRALAGIGCHYMVQWMDRSSDHFSQMGGEGVAWIGQAPFTSERHVFANLGDGTYYHSGVLAIRAAVAAGVSITYKLLYNGAVAMTGGQPLDGVLDVPQLTRQLAAEGVSRIAIVTDDPKRYRDRRALAAGVTVDSRRRLDALMRALRECEGVSVLIYDQVCAAEKRRKRHRGLLAEAQQRVVINERICEDCGDCSRVSNCLSIESTTGPFDRARHIDQSSCNDDLSCLEGACPALVRVAGAKRRRVQPRDLEAWIGSLPEPRPAPLRGVSKRVYNIVIAGVGGTGVTTVAALVGMAAHLEGRASRVLDMTGLAQKGGAVCSHVRLAATPEALHASRVPARSAELLLGCDLVVAASEAVQTTLDPARTRSVVDTHPRPTAAFVLQDSVRFDGAALLASVSDRSKLLRSLDAVRVAEAALGDSVASNIVMLGCAYQLGWLPLSGQAIERAIELNAVAVEDNRLAFALGRLAVEDPKRLDERLLPKPPPGADEPLAELVTRRETDLVHYQDAAWAARYRGLVERAIEAEAGVMPGSDRLARAVARNAYRLMAYKDEYEVARLYTDGGFARQLAREFGDGLGGGLGNGCRVRFDLAPPLFARRDRESGRLHKRSYGRWMGWMMRALAGAKRLRGTWLDPFARLPERRLERALIAEYEAILEEVLRGLAAANYETGCRLAALPDTIRGFDRLKLERAERARREAARLLAVFRVEAGEGAPALQCE